MPLDVGNWWEYEVESVDYIGPLAIDSSFGLRYAEVTFMEESEINGRLFWITRIMEDQHIVYGYYMGIEDGMLMAYPEPENPIGGIYLQGPLKAGTSWETVAWNDHDAHVTVEITGTDLTLQVPAGTFEGCLSVSMTSTREVVEEWSGTEEVSWEMFYAPGVGVVRSVILTVNPASTLSRRSEVELIDLQVR